MSRLKSDPDSALLIKVPVDRIRKFARNPRTLPNPSYDRLADSIRTLGMTSPLLVAKQPGCEDYTLQAGGNTRLDILHALAEEDPDRFKQVVCIEQTWQGEVEALLAHLRENELRGSLSFIERARGVVELRSLIAEMRKVKSLSQRDLAHFLTEQGFSISQALISHMEYAVHRLYPVMPLALNAGIGKNQVTRIRALESNAQNVWNEFCPDEIELFTDLFDGLCKRHDRADWLFDDLVAGVEYEIQQSTDLDLNASKILLRAKDESQQWLINAFTESEERQVPSETTSPSFEIQKQREHRVNPQRVIQKARQDMLDAAVALGSSFDLKHAIRPMPDRWFGYVLIDGPPKTGDAPSSVMWRLLAACCEQCKLTKRVLRPLIPARSSWTKKLSACRVTELYEPIPGDSLLQLGAKLLAVLDDESWTRVLALLSCNRNLYRTANEFDINIWEGLA